LIRSPLARAVATNDGRDDAQASSRAEIHLLHLRILREIGGGT
jgi:hypothetical protein